MKFFLYYFQITVSRAITLKSFPRCAVGRCCNMARCWLYVGTLEESSHTDLTTGFLSCNLPFVCGKEHEGSPLWAIRCHQQQIPGCSGQVFCSHCPFYTECRLYMEFLSWRASLRHAGHSAWCTDLVAGILLGKHGGWFEVPETVVARSMHCPHCMWGILTDACKSVVPSRWQALLCHLGYYAPLGAQTATPNLWLGNVALKCLQGESTIQCKCSYRQLECCHIPRGHCYLYLWFSYLTCSILLMK